MLKMLLNLTVFLMLTPRTSAPVLGNSGKPTVFLRQTNTRSLSRTGQQKTTILHTVLAPQYPGARCTICILISTDFYNRQLGSPIVRLTSGQTVTMVKRLLSPKLDVKRRVRHSSPVSRDITDQARQESPQRQVEFPKILAIVPFVRVTGHRQSEDGDDEVQLQCDTWVKQRYLEQIDSTSCEAGGKNENYGRRLVWTQRPAPTKV